MNRDALERLSKDDLIALVLAQAAQIAALEKRIGGPARPAEDPGQFLAAAGAGRQAQPRRAAGEEAPGAARQLPPVGRAAGSGCRNSGAALPALRASARPCRPAGLSRLRPYRPAADPAGGDAGAAPSRGVPRLPARLQRAGPGGNAAGFAVRPRHRGADRAPACHSGDLVRAAGAAAIVAESRKRSGR